MADDLSAAELARQLAQVRQSFADQQVLLAAHRAQISQLAERLDRAAVESLADRFARLAQVVTDSLDAATPNGPRVPRWDRMDDAAREQETTRTREWVSHVLIPWYVAGGPYRPLARCWAEHPPVLVELSLLATVWRYVYDQPRPGPIGRAMDWQDRWLPGSMRRVETATQRCLMGRHVSDGLP